MDVQDDFLGLVPVRAQACPTGVDSAVILGQLCNLHYEQILVFKQIQGGSVFVFLLDKCCGHHGDTCFRCGLLPAQIYPHRHFRQWTLDGNRSSQNPLQLDFWEPPQSSRYCRERELMCRKPHPQPHPQLDLLSSPGPSPASYSSLEQPHPLYQPKPQPALSLSPILISSPSLIPSFLPCSLLIISSVQLCVHLCTQTCVSAMLLPSPSLNVTLSLITTPILIRTSTPQEYSQNYSKERGYSMVTPKST